MAGTCLRDIRWGHEAGTNVQGTWAGDMRQVHVTFTCLQFIKEIKNNGKKLIPFLYCSVLFDNNNNNNSNDNNLRTTIYGKQTYINKLYVAYSPNHLTTLYVSRGNDFTDLDKTNPTGLWLTWQFRGQVFRQGFQQDQIQIGLQNVLHLLLLLSATNLASK